MKNLEMVKIEAFREKIRSRKVRLNGLTYINEILTIPVFNEEGDLLGIIHQNYHELYDLDNILGMTDEIQIKLLKLAILDKRSFFTDFDFIAAGIDPIESGWGDGDGNQLDRNGWREGGRRTFTEFETITKNATIEALEMFQIEREIVFSDDFKQKMMQSTIDNLDYKNENEMDDDDLAQTYFDWTYDGLKRLELY